MCIRDSYMDDMNSDYILTYFPPPSIDLSPTKQFFSDQAMKGRQSPLDRLRQVLYDYAIRLAAGFTKFARIVYNSVANHGRERKDAMNIGAAEIILILLVAFVIVGPKDLPKVARALGRFVKYVRGMVEEVKHELGAVSYTHLKWARRSLFSCLIWANFSRKALSSAKGFKSLSDSGL